MRKAFIGPVIFAILRICALFLYRGSFHKEQVKRILVYAYTGLGNFIMFTPALKQLRLAFPQAHITLQAGYDWRAEEVVRDSDIIDEVTWFRPASGSFQLLKWISKTRKKKYDLIISSFDSSLPIHTCLSGARYRVGHVSGGSYRNSLGFVYNIKVPVQEGRHEIDLKCDLLAAIGEEVIDRAPFFFIGDSSQESAARILERHGIAGRDYICIQPGAANMMLTAKRWDIVKFAILINKIINEAGVDVVLLGDKNEIEMGDIFSGNVEQKQKVHSLFGETTVKEAAAIIQKSKLMVSNDSGLMHVAVAVGTPLVAIYGPTDYRRTAPCSENTVVIRHEMPCSPCIRFSGEKRALECEHKSCIGDITVDEVFKAVIDKLNEVK